MKSRLAVSFLFILIASTFTSDAIADFKKLESLACEIYRGRAVEVLRKNSATATQSCEMTAISADTKSIGFNSAEITKVLTWLGAHMQSVVLKVVKSNYHCAACDFMKTAARQLREALGLIRFQYAAH